MQIEMSVNGKTTEVMVKEFTAPSIRESLQTAIRCIGYRGEVFTYDVASILYRSGRYKGEDGLTVTLY